MLSRVFSTPGQSTSDSAATWLRGRRDLDEPSSGLDPDAEHQIHETLRGHRTRQAGPFDASEVRGVVIRKLRSA